MEINAFFKVDDMHSRRVMDYDLHEAWWSRHYEYPWALQFAKPGLVVADMGCGWHERPFKRMLADVGCKVFAVDAHDLGEDAAAPQEGITFIRADITERIRAIKSGSLDIVFCISVLEDMGHLVSKALAEFKRCIKPDGLIVLTFDVQYDMIKPLGKYPGVDLVKFFREAKEAGLAYRSFDIEKENALFHEGFNLACYHAVLQVAK